MGLQDKAQLLVVEGVMKPQELEVIENEVVTERPLSQDENMKQVKKTSWKRINSKSRKEGYIEECMMRKRKLPEVGAGKRDEEEKNNEKIVDIVGNQENLVEEMKVGVKVHYEEAYHVYN
ncbi:hypothetical protein J1N35_000812 [Gossypium stocksii]|uniref:Uncharacterized protein n=1 Tax=Gossypium stocksii TaxID=47602 RepID=A0A9D3WIT2_9ROSI|nr:hypothetical protein J1N35_000812 [Gossypium stocksii]